MHVVQFKKIGYLSIKVIQTGTNTVPYVETHRRLYSADVNRPPAAHHGADATHGAA
jgi:hypothetical protein